MRLPHNGTSEPPWLNPLLNHCQLRRYARNATIVLRGEPADKLYYLIEGQATICLDDSDARSVLLDYVNKGDFIGETDFFLRNERRDLTVLSRTDCRVASITYTQLDHLLTGVLKPYEKDLLRVLGGQVSKRLVKSSAKVGQMVFFDATDRVSKALLDLCSQPTAITHPNGMQISVTRQEIARFVGCSREIAGRVLKKLEEEGYISTCGKKIVVYGTR